MAPMQFPAGVTTHREPIGLVVCIDGTEAGYVLRCGRAAVSWQARSHRDAITHVAPSFATQTAAIAYIVERSAADERPPCTRCGEQRATATYTGTPRCIDVFGCRDRREAQDRIIDPPPWA